MKTLGWLFVPLVLSTAGAALGDPPAPSPSGERARPPHWMRSRMLRDRVGLPPAKADKVEQILEKYAPERKRVAAEMQAARQKLRTLVSENSNDATAYRTALDRIRSGRKTMRDLMDRAFTEVSKELTPQEQAKLFLALDRARGKMGMHGHGRGHGHERDDGEE